MESKTKTTDSYLTFIENTTNLRGNFLCKCGKVINRYRSEVSIGRCKSCGCHRLENQLKKAKEFIGTKHNKLLVIDFIGKNKHGLLEYKVKCDCGKEIIVSKSNLRRQITCGCDSYYDFKIGDSFQNYNIIDILENNYYKVICSICNLESKLKHTTLINVKTFKCLCRTKFYNNLSEEDLEYYRVFKLIENGVRSRGRFFELTFEQTKNLLISNCSYCGDPPTIYSDKVRRNGIDRIDSGHGYTVENSVSCCYTCNIMKNNLPLDQFKNHIKKIYYYENKVGKDDR